VLLMTFMLMRLTGSQPPNPAAAIG